MPQTIPAGKTNPIFRTMPTFLVSEQMPADEAIGQVAPLPKPGIEDRKSCRSKVPPSRRFCEVKVGGGVLSASLVNESKDGFAVLTDRLGRLKIGKKVELHTAIGWFTVRIVYISKIARPKDAWSECDTWFRLGMKIKRRLQQPRLSPQSAERSLSQC